jgi:hypothetical protein
VLAGDYMINGFQWFTDDGSNKKGKDMNKPTLIRLRHHPQWKRELDQPLFQEASVRLGHKTQRTLMKRTGK